MRMYSIGRARIWHFSGIRTSARHLVQRSERRLRTYPMIVQFLMDASLAIPIPKKFSYQEAAAIGVGTEVGSCIRLPPSSREMQRLTRG